MIRHALLLVYSGTQNMVRLGKRPTEVFLEEIRSLAEACAGH